MFSSLERQVLLSGMCVCVCLISMRLSIWKVTQEGRSRNDARLELWTSYTPTAQGPEDSRQAQLGYILLHSYLCVCVYVYVYVCVCVYVTTALWD